LTSPNANGRWYATAAIIIGLTLALSGTMFGCGRTLSRFGLGSQSIKAPKDAQKIINIGFHKTQDGTVKDVVFLMNDCTVMAREYKDVSPFEGELRVVSHDGSPFKQAGCTPK